MDVGLIGGTRVLTDAGDVAKIREAGRRRRLFKLAVVFLLIADYTLARWLGGDAVHWGWPYSPRSRRPVRRAAPTRRR